MKSHTFLKNLTLFYVFATVLLVFGFMGIALGTYVQFFRPATPGELMLSNRLFVYSIGLVFSALIHFGAFRTIKRLSELE